MIQCMSVLRDGELAAAHVPADYGLNEGPGLVHLRRDGPGVDFRKGEGADIVSALSEPRFHALPEMLEVLLQLLVGDQPVKVSVSHA